MPAFPQVPYQPQACVLNDEGQQALAQLLQNDAARKRLQARQRKAAETLRSAAGEINDRAYHARIRHGKKLQRLEAEGEEEPEAELNDYNQYQEQINNITVKLDLGIRGIIDDIDWLANLPDSLKAVATHAGSVAEESQRTQNTIPMTTQQSRRTIDGEGEDTEMPEEDSQTTMTQLAPSDAPIALLRAALEKQKSAWNAMSLTDKYAKSNEYKGFYTTVHDSKHPDDDDVPVPHESMWFAAEEGRQAETTGVTGAGIDNGDEEELQVGHVVVSTRCPFTLQVFKDPVTSKKCPHSFERSAFYDVLKTTDRYLPFTPEQLQELQQYRHRAERARREKQIGIAAVQCPECAKLLAEVDVERNPVLQRKAQRMVAEKQREREAEVNEESDEEDDEDLPRGTQRKPVGLGSSPPSGRASGRMRSFKAESGRPTHSLQPLGTQDTTAGGATAADVDEEDADENMQDE